jgi:cephalosporin hydroxylase/SAM-dependent methyltransferase
MAHQAQREFCESVRSLFPRFFRNKRVLDCGSLDINGSNRDLFSDSEYTGVDIGPGRNVDLVCRTHELTLPEQSFDVIVSTECFEHDRHYAESLQKICKLLKPGGLLFFSCASTGRPEHGTLRTHGGDSPFTSAEPGWENYYKNLEEADIRAAMDVEGTFSKHAFHYNPAPKDLYFWGVKKGGAPLTLTLGVPTYCRYDLLDKLLLSAEAGSVRPERYIIIDNGNAYPRERLNALLGERSIVAELISPGTNIGVAAAWNRILEMTEDDGVIISNDDIELGPKTFEELTSALETHPFVEGDGWALFGQTIELTEHVGWYDENFWPAYYEDVDYEERMHRQGFAPFNPLSAPVKHHGWATTTALGNAAWLAQGRARNHDYFLRKWGGESRAPRWNGHAGISQFSEPFNGNPPAGWSLRGVDRKKAPLMTFMEDFLDRPLREVLPLLQQRFVWSTTYFGVLAVKNPLDAWIYQELICKLRPDVIVEIGTHIGGGALMLAHLCDALGNGKVIGLDVDHTRVPAIVVQHPRITLLEGDACASYDKVRPMIQASDRVLVIEDSSHTYENTLNVLRTFGGLVNLGGYFIVEDGICHHGLEVGPTPGPYEAIETFVAEDPRFTVDRELESFVITWNPKGFLKRVG